MTSTSPSAFLLSTVLHGTAILVALLLSFVTSQKERTPTKILELVAGEGDNYGAKEAPALGREGGIKLNLPATPIPTPVAPERAPVVPVPPPPVPPSVAPASKSTQPADQSIPNFKKKIQYDIVRGDAKAKLQLRREREAEAKRLADEKKRMTKEEFDRAQKNKTATKVASAKVPAIDGEGIAKGVVGGSVNNTVGGAGGKALQSDNDDVLAAYYSMFKLRLREKFEPPPGLSDSLKVTIEVRSNADGALTSARVTRTSGSREFDRAVLDAIGRVRMPSRPKDRPSESIEFVFTMRERDEG